MTDSKIQIIKLGGSNISKSIDNLFDFDYLAQFKQVLLSRFEKNEKFFVTLGGGFLMRMYRDKARAAGLEDTKQLHWIGTTVNVLHGEIVRAMMSEYADEGVYKYEEYYDASQLTIEKNLKVGGGGRPGHSGDVDAVLAAKKLGARRVYSLKNVDGVYDSDPNKNPNASRKEALNWAEYLEIIGNKTEHEPGGNYPIDPVASKMAQDAGIEFVILSGSDLENFARALNGEQFTGTIVK